MNMSTQTPEPRQKGEMLAQGKTKIIFADLADPLSVIVQSKDDITAGDGAKHDVIPDKAAYSTRATCNTFELLKAAGISVAYNEKVDDTSFSAKHGNMLLLEVVARRESRGSYARRYLYVSEGTIFPRLVFELFLKTKDRKWKEVDLPCDDPHAVHNPSKKGFHLFDVKKPFLGQKPFHFVTEAEVFGDGNAEKMLKKIEETTRKTFLVLERAWQLVGRRLVDFKIEFDDQLRVSDVIDPDSCRIMKDGRFEDKEHYRQGGALSEVAANFLRLAELTDRFALPTQALVIWRGSEKDDISPILQAVKNISGMSRSDSREADDLTGGIVVCSMHKEPTQGLESLRQMEQEVPDSIIIALIGKSNGAGPTLSAHTTMPVINCSPTVKDFHEDVWSSLRMPSEVPAMTVLDPANAAHAALNILSARNPALYAALRYRMEERFVNTITI